MARVAGNKKIRIEDFMPRKRTIYQTRKTFDEAGIRRLRDGFKRMIGGSDG